MIQNDIFMIYLFFHAKQVMARLEHLLFHIEINPLFIEIKRFEFIFFFLILVQMLFGDSRPVTHDNIKNIYI
jgi:hypothetical protein